MPRYAIAFHNQGVEFIHKIVEMDSEEAALRFFFQTYVSSGYTSDEEGYVYFREDFHDVDDPLGGIVEIKPES